MVFAFLHDRCHYVTMCMCRKLVLREDTYAEHRLSDDDGNLESAMISLVAT